MIVCCFLSGCVAGATLSVSVAVALAALAGVLALSRCGGPRSRRLSLAVAALIAGLGWASAVAPPEPPYGSPEGLVNVSGTVDALTCEPNDRCQARLLDVSLGGLAVHEPLTLTGYDDLGRQVAPGDRVEVWASVGGERADTNPGPAPPWAERRWRFFGTVAPGAEPRPHPSGPSWRAVIRAHLRDTLTLPGAEVTALYRALLLGERRGLPPELQRAFVDSGTAHLLAISGLHLAVVGFGLYRLLLFLLLRWRRLAQAGRPPAVAAALAGLLTFAYVASIAPSQATLRATIALGVVFAGAVLARRARPMPTLAVAAAVLVLADPRAPTGASFQLSFAAATALVLLAGHLRPWLARLDEPGALPHPRWRTPARTLFALVAVSLVSTAVTTPLALAWFGQASVAAPLCNLVAVPLMSLLVVPLGFCWLIVALVAPGLARLLAPLPTLAAGWLLDLVEAWAELVGPSTHAAWPHLAGLAAALAVILLLAGRRLRVPAVLAAIVAATMVLVASYHAPQLRLTLIDVGHGDAILVSLPSGQNLMVDTGGHHRAGADARLATGRLVPALTRLGVARLDLLIITHADHDHVGAAAALAERVPIAELWLPPCDAGSAAIMAVARRVAAQGGTVRQVHQAAPVEFGGAHLEILWPPPDIAGAAGRCSISKNDAALVLSLRYAGRHMLLTADVERSTEAALLDSVGARLRADVLKVGHHGSRTSSSEAFLDAVRPRLAVASGRRSRTTMPPHLDILERYSQRQIPLWLTGRDGAIQVAVDPSGTIRLSSKLGRSYALFADSTAASSAWLAADLRPP
jgi:competence protein ComEC